MNFKQSLARWRIQGGIVLPERKHLSNRPKIRQIPLSEQLVYPLLNQQKPIVTIGGSVEPYQLLARSANQYTHCGHSGRVSYIDQEKIIIIPSITHNNNSVFENTRPQHQSNPFSFTASEMRQKILEAGIMGMGGAGFSTHQKLHLSEKACCHTLLLNAAECDPYITADELSLRTYAPEILRGCDLLSHASGAKRLMIGIEDNKPEAIQALQAAIQHFTPQSVSSLEIVVIPSRYPAGSEKQLIYQLTGQVLSQRKRPADLGMICHNVGTALAVQRALEQNEPCTRRVVTFSGSAIPDATRGNYDILIGTPIKHILQTLGCNSDKIQFCTTGGQMMGTLVTDLNQTILKTTNCVLALGVDESPEHLLNDSLPQQSCIRCGDCDSVCPQQLLPQQLFWYSQEKNDSALTQLRLNDCIECGACSYVCPAKLPLVPIYQESKNRQKQTSLKQEKALKGKQRFEARNKRLAKQNAKQQAQQYNQASSKAILPTTLLDTRPVESKPAKKMNTTAPLNVTTLKTAYLKIQKRTKQAEKAFKHAEKNGMNPEQLLKHSDKLSKLHEQLQAAKLAWQTSAANAETTTNDHPFGEIS